MSAFLSGWDHEIITYTGDGAASHAIPSSFDLSVGVVAIFVHRIGNSDAAFRHSGTGMTTTFLCGSSTGIATGILSFDTTGFTVGVDGSVNTAANTYVAVILRDTSVANTYMRVGDYAGNGADNRNISVGFDPTHVWVVGRSWIYRSLDFSGDASANLDVETITANQIQDQSVDGSGTFQVGTNNNVNSGVLHYYWMALAFDDATAVRAGFYAWKLTGTAGALDYVPAGAEAALSGLPFAPAYAAVKREASARECEFKSYVGGGLQPAGTASRGFGSTANAAGGVENLNQSTYTITVGEDLAPDTVNYYGWAWAGSSTRALPFLATCAPSAIPATTARKIIQVNGGSFLSGNPNYSSLVFRLVNPKNNTTVADLDILSVASNFSSPGSSLVPAHDNRFPRVQMSRIQNFRGWAEIEGIFSWAGGLITYTATAVHGLYFRGAEEVFIDPPIGVPAPPIPPGGPVVLDGGGGPLPFTVNLPSTLGGKRVHTVMSFGYVNGDAPGQAGVVFDIRDLSYQSSEWDDKITEIVDTVKANPVPIVAIGDRDGLYRSVRVATKVADLLKASLDHRDKFFGATRRRERSTPDPKLLKALRNIG